MITKIPTRRDALKIGGAAALAAMTPFAARAASYPDSPVTVILPLPPGSVLDLLARGGSEQFRKDTSYPFIVENVPGATGNLGAARVAHARPDGKTVLFTQSSPLSANSFLFKDMPFDPDKDFTPVILGAGNPIVLVVHNSLPVHSVREYIDYAKAHPGELSYGSSGIGSPHHLCAEFLALLTNIKLNHIPYKGSPDSATDVIAGHVASAFTALPLVFEQAKAGTVRILAVTDDQRIAAAPDIPTIHETVPDFQHAPGGWDAMFAPAKTPPEVIAVLNKEMNLALKDSALVATLQKAFVVVLGGTPEELGQKLKFERDITRKLVDKIGLVPA